MPFDTVPFDTVQATDVVVVNDGEITSHTSLAASAVYELADIIPRLPATFAPDSRADVLPTWLLAPGDG